MPIDPPDQTPSWLTLFVAALLIGPAVLVGAYALVLDRGPDQGPRGPKFRSLSADSARAPSGFIAYVARAGGTSIEPEGGCVWVVHASGAEAPRRLGCSGRRGVPDTIAGLSWTAAGDLEVRTDRASAAPAVLRVHAGQAIPGAIAEPDRVHGRRGDGALVQTTRAPDAPERTAQLVFTPPDGSPRSLVSVEGPEGYSFGDPQWSPDGKWILFSDSHGRLLIADERVKNVRQLLPARPSRKVIGAPLLTWFQGSPS